MNWYGFFGIIRGGATVDAPEYEDEENQVTVHNVRFDPSSDVQQRTEEVAKEVHAAVKEKKVPAVQEKPKITLKAEKKAIIAAEQQLGDLFAKRNGLPLEDKQAIQEYCSAKFDLLFFPKPSAVTEPKKSKSEKRKSRSEPVKLGAFFSFSINESNIRKLQVAKSKLDSRFDECKKQIESYKEDVTKCRREFRKASLPETKLAKRTAAVASMWNYRTHYNQYHEEILALDHHAAKIAKRKNTFNKEIDALVEELTLLESSLMEHFHKIQTELKEIENAINPEKDPLAEVANIPTENSEFPAFAIKVETDSPSEFLAKKILEAGARSTTDLYGSLLTLQNIYNASSDWVNEIDNFFAGLFQAAAMKKTKDQSLIYDESNFSILFNTVKELDLEGEHLVSRLSQYVGSISGKRGQLTPQNKERPSIVLEAQKLKPLYKDLFVEGHRLIKKIHDRKMELEALKAKFNVKFDVSQEDIKSRKKVLFDLFTMVCDNNQKTMDLVKSGRATASTYIWGNRFHHPANTAVEGPWEAWYWNFFKENGLVAETEAKEEKEDKDQKEAV